ncbi:VacJ [Simonsiella muelleri]|uniref:VacJ n=1 Tax=Simonsiella muelleri ATCC 29453 TaxID=641147 RepID=V9H8F8_9NEIS|nr:hypothetical protein [Simonsiella muelleri]AUX61115.1 VacJ [Simonsiella muelleri ATCC 29453]EFG30920.1 hypothetical protein HMPREF9021_01148 [Simonsiella muelleri ATCC 29453]UBQ53165.1 VacJ [Simonsiella muelleri]
MYEVNRSVFIVVPREPFWQWLSNLPHSDLGDLTLAELQQDANSYLVPACQNIDEVWDEIEARTETIFAAELADWCDDESYWPDLTAELFNEWFNVQISSIVTDLADEPIEREAFADLDLNLN